MHNASVIEVAAAFELGEVHDSRVVMRGAMGQISRVVTDRGSFAVKELFAWNNRDGAEHEATFTARARRWGLAVPSEQRTHEGDLVAVVGGVRWRAYEWFDLEPDADRPPELVAEALGTLHRHATPDDGTLDPWYDTPPSAQQWHELVRSSVDEPWGNMLESSLEHLLDLGQLRRPNGHA